MEKENFDHFKGKDALHHVLETKAKSQIEPHGFEISAPTFAFIDTFKSTLILNLILFIPLYLLQFNSSFLSSLLFLFCLGITLLFTLRSGLLGWSIIERLHRNLKQEYYEIQHNRAQEREELKAMYSNKGFKEPLLNQVVDVLMSDDNTLLTVMLEEEMGLSLNNQEHPLKLALGSFIGGVLALIITQTSLYIFASSFFIYLIFLSVLIVSLIQACLEKNSLIPAAVWSLGTLGFIFASVYIITEMWITYFPDFSKVVLNLNTCGQLFYGALCP
jgi:hypothetical protein